MKSTWLSRRGLFVVGAILAGFVAILAGDGRAQAQEGQGVFVTQAAARLTKLIDAANKQGFELKNDSFSIGGGWLKQGVNAWVPLYTVQLTAGQKYIFLGAGDNDAKDVDLEVIEVNTKKVVAADAGTEADAIVAFTPANSGTYLVRLRVYASRENLPCMCLGVMMVKK